MARIRTVKPELWTDEDFTRAEYEAQMPTLLDVIDDGTAEANSV